MTREHDRPTAAVLFQRLWDELVVLVGTPATAALVRRAVKRALSRRPGIELPLVRREGLEYPCTLPASWKDGAREAPLEDLRWLVREDLDPLFRELTGPVIARRLAQVPELVGAGIVILENQA